MKTLLIAFILSTMLNTFLSPESRSQPIGKVKKQFDKVLKEKNIHSGFFSLHSDRLGIHEQWIGGQFADDELVTARTPFHITSVGKTFTATTIALLADEGKLRFDDPAANYLPTEMMQGLHVVDGVDYGNQITISHLLQHRSGLPDYFEDEPTSGENMMVLLFSQPERYWEPEELIQFTKQHFQAKFEPGADYHYTDTEYILLGLIIEQLEEKPLHQVFAERIFQPLGMNYSSMHLRSEPTNTPDYPMAELYAETYEISRLKSLSADWAGGGVLSTSEDLYHFMKALQEGKLVQPATYQKMQQWTDESQGTYYGYGLRKWELHELFPTLPKLTLIGHSGSTASFMYYCPELDTYLTGSFNQTDFKKGHIVFLVKVLSELKKYDKRNS
ncbi:MAG: serine hydrolase domain-containing protein [Cyclobacteriaceae bacterium]